MTQLSPDLATRYGPPRRSRRPLVVALASVLLLVGVVWVGWVVLFHSRPEVTSQLVSYDIGGEHRASATWTVVRRDTDTRASCLLQALAGDHSIVGELTVPVVSGPESGRLTSTLRTERRAATVQLLGCSTPDRPARN